MRPEIIEALSEAKSVDELGKAIVEKCSHVFNADVCTLWRCYQDDDGKRKLRLLAASAKAPQTLAQEITYEIHADPDGQNADGVTGFVAQTKREVHVSSFEELKERYKSCWKGRMDRTQWEAEPARLFRSLSAFPLMLGRQVVGVFKLENKRGSDSGFPESDRDRVRMMTADIASALHFHNLLDQHSERLMQVPTQMVEALLRPFESTQLVNEIVKTVADRLHAEICSLWIVDPGGKELSLADGYGFPTETRRQTYQMSDPAVQDEEIDGITAWVAVRKEPFWANSWADLKAHPSWSGKWDQTMWHDRGENFRCLYAVPLLRQHAIIGVLKVENRIGEAFFTATDRALCGIMASLIVLVLELGHQVRTSIIADMAHLVRSPIGQVPMNLSMLEKEIKKAQQGGELRLDRIESYVNIIRRALLSADMTSRELVGIAKRPAYLGGTPERDCVNLYELLTERIKELQPLLYNGIRLSLSPSNGVENCDISLDATDRTRVQIAIDNVLHNAIKYSSRGGEVRVVLEKRPDQFCILIQDDGCGISEDDWPRIWEQNFSRRAADHPQGTGMGLTMVKQVFDGLGWDCEISSTEGSGTEFRAQIPRTEELDDGRDDTGRR